MYKNAELTVGRSQTTILPINFSVRSTAVAQKWAHCVQMANQQSHLRERNRWYNFGDNNVEEEKIVQQMEDAIRKINFAFPGLITKRINRDTIQESVNEIHIHFADTAKQKQFLTVDTRAAWSELNNTLHAYESLLRSRETQKIAGIPECNIVVTWENGFARELEQPDYEHFTVAKKFGTIYVNYCHVGRHLYEMFLANDEVLAEDHIQPLRMVSADSYIWLGSTTGPRSLEARKQKIREWFDRQGDRFQRLGFTWGDPRLAIGWIPVADIVGDYVTLPSQLELIEQLRKHQEVAGLVVN